MWRTVISGVLVLLFCLVAAAAVPLRWLDGQLHGEEYGETVRPLLTEPEIHDAVLAAATDAALPAGVTIPTGVTDELRSRFAVVLQTQTAEDLWVAANLSARDAVVQGQGNRITVDLRDLVAELAREVPAVGGFDLTSRIPPGVTTVTVADSPSVGQARQVSDAVHTAAPILPWAALGLLVLGLLAARRRFTALAAAGIVLGLAMLALLGVLAVAGDRLLGMVGDERTRPIMDAAYQAFADSLRGEVMLAFGVSAGVGVVALVLSMFIGRRSDRSDDRRDDRYAEYPAY